MGIQNTDRTLPSNQMVFELRRDADRYRQFQADMESVMEHYGLTPEEKQAWRAMDISRLGEMGVHPYFLPQVSRLFKGTGYNHNTSDAARLYAEKMGIEAKEH
jgi:hypothetical protein